MKKINLRFSILILTIISLGFIRVIPHYPNFTPIGAMALFGGAYFSKKWQAFIMPIGALILSDIAINYIIYNQFTLFHSLWIGVYGSFIVITLIGMFLLKRVSWKGVVFASLSASFIFYIITNLVVWIVDPINIYANNGAGLVTCYVAGLPYFLGTIFGDLFYSAIVFSAFEYAQSRFLSLKPIKG